MSVELDVFFLNEDRHTNNLALIRNKGTGQFSLGPLFNNGLALLSDTHDYPLGCDIYDAIRRIKAKLFDTDFYEQLSAAESLYGPQLRFTWMWDDLQQVMEGLQELYDEQMLQRAMDVLYNQMRIPCLFGKGSF